MDAVLLGVAAGLGVAMPLGAVSVLLLREAMLQGLRRALAGAAGIGLVDLAYCALAVTAGSAAATVLTSVGAWPRVLAGLAVVGIGVRMLLRLPVPDVGGAAPAGGPGSVFLRFVTLTAVNPLTLVYFLALGTALQPGAAAAGFVVAAGLASLAWQSGLAVVGASLGAVLPPAATRVLGVVAAGVVLGLGLVLLVAG